MLKDLDIVIMDEVISNLDLIIERVIVKVIDEVCKDKIIIIIVYRLSIILRCDKVVVMKEG